MKTASKSTIFALNIRTRDMTAPEQVPLHEDVPMDQIRMIKGGGIEQMNLWGQ